MHQSPDVLMLGDTQVSITTVVRMGTDGAIKAPCESCYDPMTRDLLHGMLLAARMRGSAIVKSAKTQIGETFPLPP